MYKYPKGEAPLPASKVREQFSDVLNKVARNNDRVVVQRNGKPVAAVISMDDLELLQALEDKHDLELAREALADPRPSIPWEEVKKKLRR